MININIVDIEASGLDIESYPIEIAILVNGELYSWLIRPEPAWQYWDDVAQELHGISRDHLRSHGLPAKHVADEINRIVADTNGLLYSDAVQWDDDWMRVLFSATDTIREFHLLPIQDLFSDEEETLYFKKLVNEIAATDKYRRHRAADDVQLIHEAVAAVFAQAT